MLQSNMEDSGNKECSRFFLFFCTRKIRLTLKKIVPRTKLYPNKRDLSRI